MPVPMMVNLTITTTVQSLYALLFAINTQAPRNCCRVEIQGDDGQTEDVYIGSASLADNNYARKITNAGDTYEDDAGNTNSISLTNLYLKVKTAGANQTVHCRVRIF